MADFGYQIIFRFHLSDLRSQTSDLRFQIISDLTNFRFQI